MAPHPINNRLYEVSPAEVVATVAPKTNGNNICAMASLENELGVTLFEKVGRGVTLTKAGKMFLEYANRILEDCNVAVDKMQELSSDGGKLILDIFFRWRGITFRIKSEDFWNGRKIKM